MKNINSCCICLEDAATKEWKKGKVLKRTSWRNTAALPALKLKCTWPWTDGRTSRRWPGRCNRCWSGSALKHSRSHPEILGLFQSADGRPACAEEPVCWWRYAKSSSIIKHVGSTLGAIFECRFLDCAQIFILMPDKEGLQSNTTHLRGFTSWTVIIRSDMSCQQTRNNLSKTWGV